ncbi:MAG: type II toxin-antitoxin system VapC family toxin [Pirellulaceae bacterium]|nr:type II toxin-antitoxin system VapC family toxin [Pirellulaceae bacterium]
MTSQLTLDECGDGDPAAATERLEVLQGIPLLDQSGDTEVLAELLIDRKAVPASQPRDALHIATAAANGVQFLATWNFKHILNPHLQAQIAGTCREAGFIPPVICTPEQLKATDDDS